MSQLKWFKIVSHWFFSMIYTSYGSIYRVEFDYTRKISSRVLYGTAVGFIFLVYYGWCSVSQSIEELNIF